MLDAQDFKKFMQLPLIFNADALAEIKSALSEYDDYTAYIVRELETLGGNDGYKNPATYEDVEVEIKWRKLPALTEEKLLAALEKMRGEYCK